MILSKCERIFFMKYRHEWKHEISRSDALAVGQRLSVVAKRDGHTENGRYEIRSLYFDNAADKALREKIDGVNIREKFRLRIYNSDTSLIKLEKKSKINGLCAKESTVISEDTARAIINGDFELLQKSADPLVRELYAKMKTEGLRAKTIVDYTREPFVYAAGNVRVTIDSNIRTGLGCTDFLNPDAVTVPTGDTIVLEVKWDEFLPDIIRDAVQLDDCRVGAFSKYAVCRIYG